MIGTTNTDTNEINRYIHCLHFSYNASIETLSYSSGLILISAQNYGNGFGAYSNMSYTLTWNFDYNNVKSHTKILSNKILLYDFSSTARALIIDLPIG